jgi:hypothetical protein
MEWLGEVMKIRILIAGKTVNADARLALSHLEVRL